MRYLRKFNESENKPGIERDNIKNTKEVMEYLENGGDPNIYNFLIARKAIKDHNLDLLKKFFESGGDSQNKRHLYLKVAVENLMGRIDTERSRKLEIKKEAKEVFEYLISLGENFNNNFSQIFEWVNNTIAYTPKEKDLVNKFLQSYVDSGKVKM
jgi:ferritin-like protein